jgi:hypothetical protein
MDTNYKSWTINNMNSEYTWEIKSKDYKWPTTVATIPGVTVASTYFEPLPSPTEESMIEDIMNRTEDRGFFKDVVDWLDKEAPRRLQSVLKELYSHVGSVTYDLLCEVLYRIGFRTSELIERRMILGPSNNWVAEYFKDFPPGSRNDP